MWLKKNPIRFRIKVQRHSGALRWSQTGRMLVGLSPKGRYESTTRRSSQTVPVPCGSVSSQRGGGQSDHAVGTQNVTSVVRKEAELVQEVERYLLVIFGLTSRHSLGSGPSLLERGWTEVWAY